MEELNVMLLLFNSEITEKIKLARFISALKVNSKFKMVWEIFTVNK